MNRSVWSRAGIGAAVSVLMAMGAGSAHAAEAGDDSLSLKIASAVNSSRVFVRAGAIGVSIKTKSGETYDVTGPVITREELRNLFLGMTDEQKAQVIQLRPEFAGNPTAAINGVINAVTGSSGTELLLARMDPAGDENPQGLDIAALGTPPGIKGVASKQTGTLGISLGYFLSDDHTWVVEAYVLAAPLNTSVSATGRGTYQEDPATGDIILRPFGLEGQKIITSKLLPPVVNFGRYWGAKDAKFRPYTGLLASYAMFFDVKATDALNNYVGGSNPGDTTVSLKNAFGVGPVVGFSYRFLDDWHASLNIGSVKLKTQATLTTRNTLITKNSGAVWDYGASSPDDFQGSISGDIYVGENAYRVGGTGGSATTRDIIAYNGGLTALVSKGVAAARGQSNLGTYVRKNETTLTSTIFMLSVGRSF